MTPVHALALLAGVLAALGARAEGLLPQPGAWLAGLLLAGLALLVAPGLRPLRSLGSLRPLATLLAGFLLAWYRLHDYVLARLPEGYDERLAVFASIDGVPLRTGAECRFSAQLQAVRATTALPGQLHVQLRWAGAPPLHAGERWQLLVTLRAPGAAANPGGGLGASQDLRGGWHASGTVIDSPLDRRLARAGPGLDSLRERIAARIAAAIADRDAAALVIALAIGDTQRVSIEQWRVFNATGITHLVAISGLHVTLFCVLVTAAMAALWRRLPRLQPQVPRDTFAAWFGVGASCGYALLAGWSVPTQRTLLMLATWHGLRMAARPRPAARTLAAGLVGVLLLDPLAPLAPGFWLSFLAVAALLLGSAVAAGASQGWRGQVIEQGRIALALAPVTIAVFGSVSLAGLLVNLAAIPFFSLLLVPLILAATVLLAVWPALAVLLFKCAAALITWCWPGLQYAADLPLALWRVQPPVWWYALAVLALAVLLLPWRAWMRATAVLALLPALAPVPALISPGSFVATVFDLGSGEAILVRTAGHALLFDDGETWGSGGQASAQRLVPALRYYRVAALDRLLLPRLDADRGAGVAALHAALAPGPLYAGAARELPPEFLPCTSGERWQWDGVEFAMLEGSGCTLRIAAAGHDAAGPALLLPGAADAAMQSIRLAPQLAPTAVVLVPGQGSAAARSPALIAAAQARLAILSGSVHTAQRATVAATLAAWRGSGALVKVTGAEGALELQFLANGVIRVASWRKP